MAETLEFSRAEVARAYYELFTQTDIGRIVHKDLLDKFSYYKIPLFSQNPYETARNEGHREVFCYIGKTIEEGLNPVVEDDEEEIILNA